MSAFHLLLRVLLVSGFIHSSSPSNAQIPGTTNENRAIIEQDVRASLGFGSEALFLTRREDLEEDVIGLQFLLKHIRLGPGEKVPVRCIEIMDIKRQGYKVDRGSIMGAAVDLDDSPQWRAAFDCVTMKVFHLYGFPDSETGFNSLIKNLELYPTTKSDALVLLASFVSLSYLESARAEVRDELSLMRVAIDDFKGPRSPEAFNAYWNKCPRRVKKEIREPSATETTGGLSLIFFTYVEGQVRRNSTLFHSDGTLSKIESIELFTW